jgi:hypothetical protein
VAVEVSVDPVRFRRDLLELLVRLVVLEMEGMVGLFMVVEVVEVDSLEVILEELVVRVEE